MEIKQAYKRQDGTYVIDGYHVCSKETDPSGRYDIEEVKSYLSKHQEVITDEPKNPILSVDEVEKIRVAGIKAELKKLDEKAIRALRTIAAGKGKQDDIDYLTALDIEADILREKLP